MGRHDRFTDFFPCENLYSALDQQEWREMMRPGFDEWMMGFAEQAAKRSRDPSTKVGAAICRPDKTIAAVGYNGFPRRMEDVPHHYEDRSEKYDRVIHAEMNAAFSAHEPIKGFSVYITHPPCKECAKNLAQLGVARVIWRHNDGIAARFDTSRSEQILEDCGIEIAILK
jgi:dCMP deaminase